jgi:hypothetical protein
VTKTETVSRGVPIVLLADVAVKAVWTVLHSYELETIVFAIKKAL